MIDFFYKKTLLLFLLSFSLFGQTKKTDLDKLSYVKLTDLYFDNSKNQSNQIDYARAYVNKALKEKDNLHIAKGYYMFSLLYQEQKAIKYLDSVIKYSKNTNHISFPASAYSEKAYILKKQFKFREAIDNFIMAEKYSQKNNIDFYYNVRFSIAVLKSEELGEVQEALVLYRECYNYFKNKDEKTPKNAVFYQGVIFALADAFKSLHYSDSTTYYNKLGYKESKTTKNDYNAQLFVLNEGANLVQKKQYTKALDSINRALPVIIANKDEGNILAAYYYLGKVFEGLGQSDLAVKNFIKVDSLYKKTKDIGPEFISGYDYLINYYKRKENKEKQLLYLTTYMKIDSVLNKNYKELTKKLQTEYEIPHLIAEKEMLIYSLENDKTQFLVVIIALFLICVFITFYGYRQYTLKKKFRRRFEEIIGGSNTKESLKIPSEIIFEPKLKNPDSRLENIGIAEEVINQILEKLQSFEAKNEYLQPNITIQLLSQQFDTNTKYLSKIVNEYKNKTFIQYINDLRIEYAILRLQENKIFRRYTMQALALEFGFNNAESFSSAFYKKTEIKPSFFIRELDKI